MKEQESGNHDYLILLSREYYNLAHYLAQQESPAMNSQAKAFYQKALDMQLSVDDSVPYNSSVMIEAIRNEYDFYVLNGYVHRGGLDYQRSEIEEEISKLTKPNYELPEPESMSFSDYFEFRRVFHEYDTKVALIRFNNLLKFLVDSHASSYLIMKQKELIKTLQEELKRGFVTKEEDPEYFESLENGLRKCDVEIPEIPLIL